MIVPPFAASALSATLIPSASVSLDCTTYRNASDDVPEPDAYSACRVFDPIPKPSCGVPPVTSTFTVSANRTVATIVSSSSYVLAAIGVLNDNSAGHARLAATR